MRRLYVDGGRISTLRTFSSVENSLSPTNRALAGEHLVEDDAQREDVAAPIERQAAHLLGRHVAELALEDARPASCDALPAALAMPKSISFTSPSYETSTFCGETSRWTRCSSRPWASRLLCA